MADIIISFDARTILDLFGGSGTTLMACEELYEKFQTKCYMIEKDPTYCGLIIERWEEKNNKKAELIKKC